MKPENTIDGYIARCAATLDSGLLPDGAPPDFFDFLRREIADFEARIGKPVRIVEEDGVTRCPGEARPLRSFVSLDVHEAPPTLETMR